MALQKPPPQKPKPKEKTGLGCLGCGCIIVLVIVFLFVGVVGGLLYLGYEGFLAMGSNAPADIPAYNGSEDIFTGAQKKLNAFNQDVANAQSSKLVLSADELNSLFAHDKDLEAHQVRVLFTFAGDEARLQTTIPSKTYVGDFFKGKYLNVDANFAVSFNADTKWVNLDLHKLQIHETPVDQKELPSVQSELNFFFNFQLQKFPACKHALEAAKTVTVKDSQLVIETK